jgi:hypothetical protein
MIYVNNPRNDTTLPVIEKYRPEYNLNPTHEEGYVLYLKNKVSKDLSLEPYYIYKRESAGWGYVAPGGLQAQKGYINTLGVFSKYLMDPWTFHFQAAEQVGKFGLEDRKANGGYIATDYDIKDMAWKPQLNATFVYLSGDNKKSTRDEGWDPLWTRFPIYSELYAQEYQNESGNSYWTNLEMYRIGATVNPTKKAKFNLNYSFLRANALIAPVSAADISGAGKNRGHLIISKLDYTFNKNICGYLLAEYFIPCRGQNGFYSAGADPAIFTRAQLEFKF